MKPRMLFVLVPLALLGACATFDQRQTDDETLGQYMDHAGAPIESFTYLGRFDSWRPLGRDKVFIRTGSNDAYLLTVAGPCRDLRYAKHLAVTSSGHTVSRRFDAVRVGDDRCMITEIRPVDYRQLRLALKQDR